MITKKGIMFRKFLSRTWTLWKIFKILFVPFIAILSTSDKKSGKLYILLSTTRKNAKNCLKMLSLKSLKNSVQLWFISQSRYFRDFLKASNTIMSINIFSCKGSWKNKVHKSKGKSLRIVYVWPSKNKQDCLRNEKYFFPVTYCFLSISNLQ